MVSAEIDWESLLIKSPLDGLDQLLKRTSRDRWLESIYIWQRQLEVYHAELLAQFDQQLKEIPLHMANLAQQVDKLDTRSITHQLNRLEEGHMALMNSFKENGIMDDLNEFWEAERERERKEREAIEQEWNALCREMRHALSIRELDDAETCLRRLESFALKHPYLKDELELLRLQLIELVKNSE